MPRFRFALLLTALAAPAPAADWPQFLGADRLSETPDAVAPWTDAPKVAWRRPLGEAHSSPVVANGVVYAFFKPKKEDADALAAFDAKSGEPLWTKSYPRGPFSNIFGDGPRGTPTVAGGAVYTLGGTGVLAKWDAKTGDVLWKRDLLADFNTPNLGFGVSTSPTVVGDTVVVMVGGQGKGLAGFDAATGKTLWQASDDPASYATPLPLGPGPEAPLAALTAAHLRAVTPAGKLLWAVPFKDRLNESSTTPVRAGDLIVAGSVTAGAIGVRPNAAGDAAEVVWRNKALTMYFSTPVLANGVLFTVTGAATLTNPAVNLHGVDPATGKVLWTQPRVGKYHAALVKTGDGKLLMLDDAGNLLLLKPGAERYEELCRAKVCGETWSHPAVADGRLYLRDSKELVALELPAK